MEILIGETLSRGNGTDGKDVYKIEETENNGYVLVYCDENNNRKELSTFEPGDSDSLEETDPSLFEIHDGVISVKNFGDYYDRISEWTIENVVIPSEINGEKVTTIGNNFMNNDHNGFKNVKSIVIPEGITSIEERAFYSLNIENVKLPSTLTNIGNIAFRFCGNLVNITIPSSVTSIGNGAFEHCTSIESIIIPSSVTNMGEYVFYGWKSNQSICIEFNVNEIPDTWSVECAEGCDALIVFEEDLEYFTFAKEYLASKNQEELEELILKTERNPGTFEEFLTEIGMTREEWEQQASNEDVSYIDWLKGELYGVYSFSWVRVEYEVSKNGGAGKTLEELETIFAQRNGIPSFDEYLSNINMTREQFEEKIKNQGFRTEEDYLKYSLYYPV